MRNLSIPSIINRRFQPIVQSYGRGLQYFPCNDAKVKSSVGPKFCQIINDDQITTYLVASLLENRGRYFAKKPKKDPGGTNFAQAKFPEFSKLSGSTP